MKIIDFSNIDNHIFKFTVLRNMNMYYKDLKYFKYGEYNHYYTEKNLATSTLTLDIANSYFYGYIKDTGPNFTSGRNDSLPYKYIKKYNGSIPIYDKVDMEVYFAFSNTGLYDIHTTQEAHPVFNYVTYNDGTYLPNYRSNFFDTVFTNIYYNNYYKPNPVTFSDYTNETEKAHIINMSLNFFNNIMYTTQVELRMDEYVLGATGTYYGKNENYFNQNRRDYFTDIQSFCDYLDFHIIRDQVDWSIDPTNTSPSHLFLNRDDDTNNASIKNYALQWIDWCKTKNCEMQIHIMILNLDMNMHKEKDIIGC